jgi:ribosomal protein S27E
MQKTVSVEQKTVDNSVPLMYAHTRSKIVLAKAKTGFHDVRCRGCDTLLYRMKGRRKAPHVEVKCRKCGTLNLD